jgi:hypothetical protein
MRHDRYSEEREALRNGTTPAQEKQAHEKKIEMYYIGG